MEAENVRKYIKNVMNILGDLDLLIYKKRFNNQNKLHKAYEILDDLDAKLEREYIREQQKEDKE